MLYEEESHSHKAYQDFIRNIGAPVTLLRENAKTLIGKKWTKTSRDNITKQRQIAPHNQQQNQSEGRLGKVKTRTLLLMCKPTAPLTFWCYCLQFVVDYMNHSSVKSLDWKTPVEKLQGKTPDISMFRFGFWAPVWYYETTAKFLAPNYLPARHLEIASKDGDYFTYKVWNLPDNKWEDGCELVRDIVTM